MDTKVEFTIYVVIAVALLVYLASSYFRGRCLVPHNHEFIIEFFGKYYKTCKSGHHWFFPDFGVFNIASKTFMGDQVIPLNLGDTGLGGGVVDFKDESAGVQASLILRVFDSYKATYEVDEFYESIIALTDATLRSFLSQFTVEQANDMKNGFTVDMVAAKIKPIDDDGKPVVCPPIEDTLYYQQLQSWGVTAVNIVVLDIDLPAKVIEQRSRMLQAEMDIDIAKKDVEISKIENQSKVQRADTAKTVSIIAAQGKARSMEVIAGAESLRIKALTDKGMSIQQAEDYILSLRKSEALEGSEKVFWFEGGNKAAETGAVMGAVASEKEKEK